MITKEEIQNQIERLLLKTNREGADKLVEALKRSDFYIAPASTVFHDNFEGGLALHSLKLLEIFSEKVIQFGLALPEDSVIICSLLHDLCKVNYYKIDEEPATLKQTDYLNQLILKSGDRLDDFKGINITKNYASSLIDYYKNRDKYETRPVQQTAWKIEDKLPLGHGEKSIYLAQRYIQLTEEEACIIRWHLAGFEPGILFGYPSGFAFKEAVKLYPTIVAFFTSDYEVAYLKKKVSNLY